MVLDQAQTVTGAKNFSATILLSGSAVVDLNGIADSLVLDEDGDTTISSPTDDQIDIEVGGADLYKFTATAFVSGSNLVSDTTNTDSLGTTALTWSDLYLGDSSVLAFGEDQDVTLTHDPDDGIFLNAGMKLAFRDMGGEYIYSVADGTLGIVAATEVDITTTTLDVNGAMEVSGTLNVGASTAIANVKDEDNMSSNSATSLSTQQSIKAYVDSQVATADTLTELTDTNITSAADASMLLYDTGTSTWIDNVMSGDATMADTGAVTFAGTNTNLTTLANVTTVGTIGTGAWEGTAVASAYLDAQTAHLNVTQSFTGAKTFGAATQFNSTVTVGADDTGYDVKFFGAAAGAYMEWDQSADQLRIMGASADATTSTGKLLLATSLTDINTNDVLGKIEFQAPHEAGGTDAITVAASIQAIAQGTFSASVNATDLIFYTGHSEAATEKFRFTSQGELGVGGANYGSDGQVLTSAGANLPPAWETPASASGDVTGITSIYNTSLKMGRDSQNLIDFATTDDKIILRVANVDEVELVANVLQPTTSDGVALGTASLMWSDLFLASGSVVNFAAGDVTLTHSSNTLTVAGGTLAGAAITGTTIDAATDFTIGDTVITDGVITDTSGLSVVSATTVTGALTVGVDDTGHDVKFFGAAAGAYMEWDESANQLRIVGPSADATTSTGKLLLATSLNDINAGDVIGKIEFQAPLETGADAISVSASIKAIAQSTFTSSSNATDLIFSTGDSETATEKFRITSQGELGIGGANYGSDGQVLTSGGAGAAPAWEAAASSGHTIQEEGSGLTARANLNFVGAGVTATDNGSDTTIVTVSATGASMPFIKSDGTTSDPIALTSAAVGNTLVSDTSPQLGGNLDVNGQSIVSDASNENIPITPHGTGSVVISKADINGGAIDGTAIGAASASTGAFTTLATSSTSTISGDMTFGDNVKVTLGDGGDADIYYDATDLIINPKVAGSGKLGIGNTTPTAHSNSSGTSVVIGTGAADAHNDGLSIISGTTGKGRIAFGDGNGDPGEWMGVIQYQHAASASDEVMGFGVGGNAIHLALTGAGNVGIGTDNPSGYGGVLAVAGDFASWYAISAVNDGNNANRNGIRIQCGADDASGQTTYINALDGDGHQVGYIWNNSGTFQLVDGSDERGKEDIVDTTIDGLATINAISVKDFTRKKSGDRVTAGFTAQQMQTAYPSAVSQPDDVPDVLYDNDVEAVLYEKGDEIPDGKSVGDVKTEAINKGDVETAGYTPYMGVAKDALIGPLVKAVQQLTARITALESA
jgi:hypothetical protein